MNKSILALGIECSCDDTAIGLVKLSYNSQEKKIQNISGKIISSHIFNQKDLHTEYGGVVPEIAARAHSNNLQICLEKTLAKAKISLEEINVVCVTSGPGLIGGLISGINFAKGISFGLKKNLVGVNHLAGHALTPRLTNDLQFPYLMLLASGGHCQYLAVTNHNTIKRLGTTIDDAPGEAFDKVAKLIGLKVYSGAEVESIAKNGDPNRFVFPLPLIKEDNCNLSFSGLKSAVARSVEELIKKQGGLYKKDQMDICASFQKSIVEILSEKTKKAFKIFQKNFPEAKFSFSISGGVAANLEIRKSQEKISKLHKTNFFAPPMSLCTDNGLMIAYAGGLRYIYGDCDDLNLAPKTRWPLDPENKMTIGFGKKGRKV